MDDEKHDQFYLNRAMLGTALRAEEIADRERDHAEQVRRLEPAAVEHRDSAASSAARRVAAGLSALWAAITRRKRI